LPVSSTSLRPAQSSSSRWISNIHSSFLGKGEAQGQGKTARSCTTAPGDPAMSIGSSPWFGAAAPCRRGPKIQAVTRFVLYYIAFKAREKVD
jgi:hypothetical protein